MRLKMSFVLFTMHYRCSKLLLVNVRRKRRGTMFQVAEGIKGVHILGVVQSKDALEDLLRICPINPQSRYVLIEVGMHS